MRFEWDASKARENRKKHGLTFAEAATLFESGVDFLEIYDDVHSIDEDRFIAIGPIKRGVVVIVYVERTDDVLRLISARFAARSEKVLFARFIRERK